MMPIKYFKKADLPKDLFFVRKPERSQGRVTIPNEIVSAIDCKIGDMIVVSARNVRTDATVTFTQQLKMTGGKFTMGKASREAIDIKPLPGQPGFNSGYEYPGVEFHIIALYHAPENYKPTGRPRATILSEPNTYNEETQ
ncbi:MAG: hypothetical protein WC277_07400 [Bacilli bacterium]